jgi:hypothetical protein
VADDDRVAGRRVRPLTMTTCERVIAATSSRSVRPLILIAVGGRLRLRKDYNGPPCEIGKQLRMMRSVNRATSQIYRLERVAGCRIIAPPRSNSAHLHRPWHAIYNSMPEHAAGTSG